MKNIKHLRIMCIYAVVAVIILITAVIYPQQGSTHDVVTEGAKTHIETEYVYVRSDIKDTADITQDSDAEVVYLVREYMGVIGIFLPDGTLFQIIDTHVKTLPDADKQLLKEGFEIIGQRALNSIIEDYS